MSSPEQLSLPGFLAEAPSPPVAPPPKPLPETSSPRPPTSATPAPAASPPAKTPPPTSATPAPAASPPAKTPPPTSATPAPAASPPAAESAHASRPEPQREPEPPPRSVEQLSAELRHALLRELLLEYGRINATFFRGKLRPVALELSASQARLGRWVTNVRTIELSEQMLLTKPWGVVVEVLKHEMAHQYVHEVLGVEHETAHGPAFREVCEKLGIDGAATGVPQAAAAGDPEGAKIFERIAKLLALAESKNQNEAQAAMAAAQRLMLKHNIDSIHARADRGFTFRHVGEPTGRVSEAERIVSAILGAHFFVESIWVPAYRPQEGKWGSVLEICGTLPNVEMAAYVHDFLHHTAAQLWAEHKRATRTSGDRDRRTFLAGVMTGFYEKLQKEKKKNIEQGLVWVKDADLEGYYRKRHPRIQNVRTRGARRTEAHAHGRAAGRNIEIHRPMHGGTAGPRLLGK